MYGIEYTTILIFLTSITLLNYMLKSITRIMDYIIYRFLLIVVILATIINAQNYGVNLPITGSMDTAYADSTQSEPF
nr:truncated VP7 [Rotavirus A]